MGIGGGVIPIHFYVVSRSHSNSHDLFIFFRRIPMGLLQWCSTVVRQCTGVVLEFRPIFLFLGDGGRIFWVNFSCSCAAELGLESMFLGLVLVLRTRTPSPQETACLRKFSWLLASISQLLKLTCSVSLQVNPFSTWRLHVAWMYCECAHEQLVRRTLTLTHTITAVLIKWKCRTCAHTHLCN